MAETAKYWSSLSLTTKMLSGNAMWALILVRARFYSDWKASNILRILTILGNKKHWTCVPGTQQSPETPKIRPDRRRGSFGAGRRQRRGHGVEPSGPAVGAADPCEQVRRDTPVAGGEGGALRGRPWGCRPLRRRVLNAPNQTGVRNSERRKTGPGCRARAWQRGLTAIQLRTRKGPRYGTDEDRRGLPLRAAAQ
ncbi:hypothetical protein NDU88_001897 [Pleurodeles waltl]|uniref:Uncharacterized protein n=1 Tax=Pleurodeles waltl TaxID=8319 RepID=A0AAV7P555_PLEWA|nr:hypothetical protein NDU88_001897 [Pleurodeles waltl]